MMSLTKFQLCLNHENPNIVKTGLIEFSNQVLKDHDVVNSFGCYGRSYSNETEDLVKQGCFSGPVKGILQSYIQSSPRLDELFVLWQLSGRDDDDSLCIAHTRCMTVLLFCTDSLPHLQKLIAGKLVHEYVSSVLIQLSNGSAELRKATIGLLLAIVRIKNEEMTNKVLDLILSDASLVKDNDYPTSSGIQFRNSDSPEDFEASTDVSFLSILLYLTVLSTSDEAGMNQILGDGSPLLRLLDNILTHSKSIAHLVLTVEGLMLVPLLNKTLHTNLLQVQVMNKVSVSKWLELFSHEEPLVKELIGRFVEAVSLEITGLFKSREKSIASADPGARKVKPLFAMAKDVSASLLDQIDPSTIREHEKVKRILFQLLSLHILLILFMVYYWCGESRRSNYRFCKRSRGSSRDPLRA